MTFSRGFRVAYWLTLVLVLARFLYLRMEDAVAGSATAFDALVLVIWFALLLAPLFSDIEILGVKLKQQLDEVRKDVVREIGSLRAEVTSAIAVQTHIAPQFIFPTPPTDAQLPAVEQKAKQAIAQVVADSAPEAAPTPPQLAERDPNIEFLFWVRLDLERELRRIAVSRDLPFTERGTVPVVQLSKSLLIGEHIDQALHRAIRDVYAVCSRAVHGEPISEAQLRFVQDVGPQLVGALKRL